jgi:hypothetical protein
MTLVNGAVTFALPPATCPLNVASVYVSALAICGIPPNIKAAAAIPETNDIRMQPPIFLRCNKIHRTQKRYVGGIAWT